MPLAPSKQLPYIGIDAASGSVIYGKLGGRGLEQDNANFFWDRTAKRLDIGATAGGALHVGDAATTVSYEQWGGGSTAALSAAGTGRIRYNEVANQFEASVNGGAYAPIGGASGLTIGDPIAGGAANRVLYEDGSNQLAEDAYFTYDPAANNLTIGLNGTQSTLSFGASDYIWNTATGQMRYVASGTGHLWYIGGPLVLSLTTAGLYPNLSNSVDLGVNLGRFKDAYLAGNLYLNSTTEYLTATAGSMDFYVASGQVADLTATELTLLGGVDLAMVGSTSGTLTHAVPATVTDHTLVWPAAQGGASTVLTNDGLGNLSWAAAYSGLTIGDAIAGGAANRVLYEDAGNLLAESANLTFDGSSLEASPNTDTTHVFGRVALHAPTTDYAAFSHYDRRTISTHYALRQQSSGQVRLNSAADIQICELNVAYFQLAAINRRWQSVTTGGPAMIPSVAGSATVPTLVPNWSSVASGLGGASNVVYLIGNSTTALGASATAVDLYQNTTLLAGSTLGFVGATSGTLTHSVPATVTDYTVVWPNAQGGASTALVNDGAGNLSWTAISTFGVTLDGAYDYGGAAAGRTINIVDSSPVELYQPGVGATTTDAKVGLHLHNDTAAAAGAQQYSPMIVLEGQGWETDVGSSMEVKWALQVQPIQGAATPSSEFHLLSSINGGAFTSRWSVTGGSGSDITAGADTDTTNIFGRARIDARTTDVAYFSHYDRPSSTEYALKQVPGGATTLNSSSGNTTHFAFEGVDAFTMTASGFYAANASGPAMLNEASSNTNPTLIPDRSNLGTGVGGASNIVYLIGNSTTALAASASAVDLYQDTTLLAGSTLGFVGATSGTLTHSVPATVTDYTLVWPAAQGGASTVLTNDGLGNLSWAAAAGGLTIGDAITGGAANRVLYEDAGNLLAEAANFTYDGTNLLTIGTSGFLSLDGTTNVAGNNIRKAGADTTINTAGGSTLYFKVGNTFVGDWTTSRLRVWDNLTPLNASFSNGDTGNYWANTYGRYYRMTEGVAPSTITNWGTLWVASGAPNTLMFRDDAGTDHNLIAGLYTGLTIGDSIASGTAGRVLYEDAGNLLAESANLTFDGTILDVDTLTVTNTAQASGTPTALTVTGGAHTNLTSGAQVIGVNLDLSATKTWATGAVAAQREVYIQAPTYAFAAASTMAAAATVSISGAPIEGANATISLPLALYVESGTSMFGGNVAILESAKVAPTSTPATLQVTQGAHTDVPTTDEVNAVYIGNAPGINYDNGGGTLALARTVWIDAPTYTADAAFTITDAAALYVERAPVAGSNVTITRTLGLWVDDGVSRLDDGLLMVERAGAAITPAATYGALYVRNDTPNQLVFVDDTATPYALTPAHGRVAINTNTTATTIDTQNVYHAYYGPSALTQANMLRWTYQQGTRATINSIADAGGGQITITTAANHNLSANDPVTLTGGTGYDGVYPVLSVGSPTTFNVTATFVATGTGFVQRPDQLIAGTGAAGVYDVKTVITSSMAAGSNETYAVWLAKNYTVIADSRQGRKHGSTGDVGNWTVSDLISVADGDRIWLAFQNNSGTNNIVVRNVNWNLSRS